MKKSTHPVNQAFRGLVDYINDTPSLRRRTGAKFKFTMGAKGESGECPRLLMEDERAMVTDQVDLSIFCVFPYDMSGLHLALGWEYEVLEVEDDSETFVRRRGDEVAPYLNDLVDSGFSRGVSLGLGNKQRRCERMDWGYLAHKFYPAKQFSQKDFLRDLETMLSAYDDCIEGGGGEPRFFRPKL